MSTYEITVCCLFVVTGSVSIDVFIICLTPQQKDVPDHPSVLLRGRPGRQVYRADGHRARGQQTLPLRLPPVLVAGGGKGRPASACQVGLQQQTRQHAISVSA